MEKEIYLIRHGETDYNRKGIIQGKGVDAPLNNLGNSQAASFYLHYRNHHFDAIYASNLQRSIQSVMPFVKSGYQIKSYEEIAEINWGIHEGKQGTSELRKQYKQILSAWQEGQLDHKIPEGESPRDVEKRVSRFMHNILSLDEKCILICSHGRTMRVILCHLLKRDLRDMDSFPHRNLGLYRLKYNNSGFEMIDFNNTDHLKNIPSITG